MAKQVRATQDQWWRIKEGKIYTVSTEDSVDYQFKEIGGRHNKHGFTTELQPPKPIIIKGLKCNYAVVNDKLMIKHLSFTWEASFTGDPVLFIEENEQIIFNFLLSKIDARVGIILKQFDNILDDKLKELDPYFLPNTKDLHLTKAIELVSSFAEKVSKQFDDPTVVETISGLFNKIWTSLTKQR